MTVLTGLERIALRMATQAMSKACWKTRCAVINGDNEDEALKQLYFAINALEQITECLTEEIDEQDCPNQSESDVVYGAIQTIRQKGCSRQGSAI